MNPKNIFRKMRFNSIYFDVLHLEGDSPGESKAKIEEDLEVVAPKKEPQEETRKGEFTKKQID